MRNAGKSAMEEKRRRETIDGREEEGEGYRIGKRETRGKSAGKKTEEKGETKSKRRIHKRYEKNQIKEYYIKENH